MLLHALRVAKDWAKKESEKDGSLLSRLWAFASVVPKGQALSLVVLCSLASFSPQIYDDQITAVTLVALAVLMWKGRQWVRLPLLFFAGYLVLACAWHFGVDDGMSPKLQAVTAAVTARHTLFVILLGSASIVICPSVTYLAPLFLTMGVSATLLGWPILKNDSTNAAMLVMCLPYCRKWWLWALTAWIVWRQQGATAWMMLAAISVVTCWGMIGKRLRIVTPLMGLGLGLAVNQVRPSFFILADRWDEYKLAYRFFREVAHPLIGFGLGSFQVLGPAMQKWDSRPVTEVWMSLHSDWLQCLFELGLVGFLLSVWLVLDSLVRSDRDTQVSLMAAMLFGLFYFPMQIPLVAFFIILIVVQVQKLDGAKTN